MPIICVMQWKWPKVPSLCLRCIPARPACVAGCDTGGRTARQSPPGKLYTCAAILHTSLYWWLTVNRAAGATAGQSYTTTSNSK